MFAVTQWVFHLCAVMRFLPFSAGAKYTLTTTYVTNWEWCLKKKKTLVIKECSQLEKKYRWKLPLPEDFFWFIFLCHWGSSECTQEGYSEVIISVHSRSETDSSPEDLGWRLAQKTSLFLDFCYVLFCSHDSFKVSLAPFNNTVWFSWKIVQTLPKDFIMLHKLQSCLEIL